MHWMSSCKIAIGQVRNGLNAKASQSSETQRRELNVQLNFLNSLFQRFSEFEMILQLLSSLEKPAKNSASLLNLLVSDCRTTALNLINQVAEDVDTEAHFTASLASPSRVRSIDHGNDESSTALAPFNDESSPSASSKSARLLLSLQMQIITQFDSLSLFIFQKGEVNSGKSLMKYVGE